MVSAKKNRKISEAFKKLNVGRKLEIANIERKANLTPNDTICDIGCGDGFWSYYFSKLAKEIVAVDPYSNDLTHAQNRYASKRLFFLQSVGENIPIQSSKFDKVISICVFEHTYDDFKVFCEIYRILRPGGKLLATVDSLNSPFVSASHREWHIQNSYCSQLYTKESIKSKLFAAGFQSVEVSYLMTSRFAVLWEILTERLGAGIFILGPLIYPIIVLLERNKATSGYKIFVEAQK